MITKDEILNKVTEEDLIKFFVPDFSTNTKKNYKSCFTDTDEKPSLSFYQENGSWKFKSHNTGNQGDVWQLWADMLSLDCKSDFTKILHEINDNLNLGLNGSAAKNKSEFKIEYKQFSDNFLAYWKQYGINQETLLKYNVKQVQLLKFKGSKGKVFKFDYNSLNWLVSAYLVNGKHKIYIPEIEPAFNDDLSFRGQKKAFGYKDQRSSDIFGLRQLPAPPMEHIIFSAGEKDCLAMNAHGFNAISLQSENQLPQESLINQLKQKCKFLLCCYDNDEAGKRASDKLYKNFGINSIELPEGTKDVADFFKNHDKKDFDQLLRKAIEKNKRDAEERKQKQSGSTIFHQAEDYLRSKYQFRYNSIKHVYETTIIDTLDYKELNENSLFVELNKAGIKISLNNLKALLKSDFCPRYNPIGYYFENLKEWNDNEPDYIEELASYIAAEEQEEFTLHFKKWMVRAVKCALEEGYYNKHALILVHAQQNSGKSSFCRFLCPPTLKEYIAENIEPGNKDSLIALASNFVINLDELKQFSNSDINVLKSWISQDKVNVRLPYESRSTVVQRVCSFVGSTNESEFLKDHTGSVRWLCFRINSISHDYNNYITGKREVNIDDVWAQAYSLYMQGFKAELTAEELRANEERNNQFKQLPPEMELIPTYVEQSREEDGGVFMTSTDILGYIQGWTTVKLNNVMIGRGLAYHQFKKVKHSKTQRYGYWVKKLITINSIGN